MAHSALPIDEDERQESHSHEDCQNDSSQTRERGGERVTRRLIGLPQSQTQVPSCRKCQDPLDTEKPNYRSRNQAWRRLDLCSCMPCRRCLASLAEHCHLMSKLRVLH